MKIKKLNESIRPSQATLDDCLQDYLNNAFGYDGVEDYVDTQYPMHSQEFKSEIVNYIKSKKLKEGITNTEPVVKFQGKSSHTFTKDKKWEVDFDEAGNILARTRHGKPYYFKGHINDKVNDFPNTDEDNIILAAREQHGLKFGNKEVKEGYSHFEFTSGSNPYIAKTKDEAERIKRSRGNSARYVGSINGIDYYKVDDSEKDLFRVDDLDENLKEAFKPSDSGIQSVKCYNRYNYTIQELRVDNDNKTFERGNFTAGKADKKTKNRQEFEDVVDTLKELGYTEIKSDYRSMRNKSRKGTPTSVEEGYELSPRIDYNPNHLRDDEGKIMADRWYASKWPDDEVGIEQLKGITLDDALKDRSILGHCDTQVRERVYAQLDKYIPLSVDSPMYKEKNESKSIKESDEDWNSYKDMENDVLDAITDYADLDCGGCDYNFKKGYIVCDFLTDKGQVKFKNYLDKYNIIFNEAPFGRIYINITDLMNSKYVDKVREDKFSIESKSIKESKATHCVYFSMDGGKTQEIEFEGTEDECQDYIEKQEADNEFGDEAPERFVKRINESKESDESELITQYINNGEYDKLEKVKDGTNIVWKLKEPVNEASYGGAFDIADDQYFTREDLDDFAEEVLNHINETFKTQFDIASCYIDDGVLEVCVTNDEYGDYIHSEKIDMRKIKGPWHLKRAYAFEFASQLINDITQTNDGLIESFDDEVDDLSYYYNEEDIIDALNDVWEEKATKQVPDVDGFLTDYTMYKNINTGEYVFVFGDKDIYRPEDGNFDWECETEGEAQEWFDNYVGFDDDLIDECWSSKLEEETETSPIVHKKSDGSYLIQSDNGDGYTAFNKDDVCQGHISASNEAEAKNKFNSNKFDE